MRTFQNLVALVGIAAGNASVAGVLSGFRLRYRSHSFHPRRISHLQNNRTERFDLHLICFLSGAISSPIEPMGSN
ncbi:hypothetical protein [Bosea sp. (in: a-proteobacteria)]|uniref:hypothetical protein n=1 Tax=Bosea sp. (in: a-proteobacteria) TaxID=1871050 RepID=UPI002FC6F570